MATEYRELNAVIRAIWSVKISPDAEIFNALKRAIEEEVKNIEPADVGPVDKICKVQLEDCIRAIREFPAADGVGERLEKLEQLEKLLPVRPGDVVYETDGIRVYRRTVRRIVFDCGTFAFDEDAIANGNVFLTERDAEQAAGVFRKAEAGTGEKEGGS